MQPIGWIDLTDDIVAFMFTFLPMTPYWFSLQRLGRKYRNVLRRALRETRSLDFINIAIKARGAHELRVLLGILRIIAEHSGTEKFAQQRQALPEGQPPGDTATRHSEFPWVLLNSSGSFREIAFGELDMRNTAITCLRLPSGATLNTHMDGLLLALLPNLKSITFNHQDLRYGVRSTMLRHNYTCDTSSYQPVMHECRNDALEEVVILGADSDAITASGFLHDILGANNNNNGGTFPSRRRLPGLRTVKFVCSHGCGPARLTGAALSDGFEFREWDAQSASFTALDGSPLPRPLSRSDMNRIRSERLRSLEAVKRMDTSIGASDSADDAKFVRSYQCVVDVLFTGRACTAAAVLEFLAALGIGWLAHLHAWHERFGYSSSSSSISASHPAPSDTLRIEDVSAFMEQLAASVEYALSEKRRVDYVFCSGEPLGGRRSGSKTNPSGALDFDAAQYMMQSMDVMPDAAVCRVSS